jgi:hypothetical protein
MHAAACAGDVDAFFSHVDEPQVLANFVAPGDGGAPARATGNLDSWRKDIKEKAKDGSLCAWSFDRDAWEKSGDLLRIDARTKKGRRLFLSFGSAVEGQPLKLTKYDAELIAKVDTGVDVRDLLGAYKDNELRGDAEYKGKRVLLVGKAGEVKRDEAGAIYLIVNNGTGVEFPEAQCFFTDPDKARLATITRGQLVAVAGVVTGLHINVQLDTCSLASTAALENCYKLQEAGVANQCVVKWMTDDHDVIFLAAAPPASLTTATTAKWNEFSHRISGFVLFCENDETYSDVLALANSRLGKLAKSVVSSRTARVIVELPQGATDDQIRRARNVVDHLPAAD